MVLQLAQAEGDSIGDDRERVGKSHASIIVHLRGGSQSLWTYQVDVVDKTTGGKSSGGEGRALKASAMYKCGKA